MEQGYFHRVAAHTPTKFWINNPTREQAELAIEAGALGCTNNPSYTWKMLIHPAEGAYAKTLLDEAVKETTEDNQTIAVLQRKLVKPVQEKFLPIYEQTGGEHGYVSIQGDPIHEDDPEVIIREALENRRLGPNICAKIPTTQAGLAAMEALIAEDVPLNATEIMGLSQGISICEMYLHASKKTGKRPKLYLSHIAGIYDDHLKNCAARDKIDISPDLLCQGGLAATRKLHQIMQERRYPGTIVGGGARALYHFTEMVGLDACVTINWEGTADQLLAQNPPVIFRFFNPVPQVVLDELMAKLPDFKRGYLSDGLSVEEYEEFGPVELFRSSFVSAWQNALDMIHERRAAMKG